MRKLFIIVVFLMLGGYCFSQPPSAQTRILSRPKGDECRFEKKPVSEVKPSNCDLESGCNYLYPVLVEDFDNNFDLPNKWQFKVHGGNDDNVTGEQTPSTWYGDAYYYNNIEANNNITNNNIKLNNGIMKMITKPFGETRDGKGYPASGGAITSWSNFRTGVFEARIKLPTANKMWPAFWLFYNSGTYAEIDIFEFYDDDIGSNGGVFSNSNCNTYDLHKMTLHTGSSTLPFKNECYRDDKYPLDIDQWHTYKLVWDEYQTSIFVDGQLKGFASKYYNGISNPQSACRYGSAGTPFDAAINYDCNMLSNVPNNITITTSPQNINWGPRPKLYPSWLPWPPFPPLPDIQTNIPNRVDESIYFPNKNSAMSLVLNSGLNIKYFDQVLSGYSESALTMEVDWIRVYQPFCCGVDKTVCSLTDLDNQTYYTDILTGRKLNVGYSNNSCTFQQNLPRQADYRDIPVILLATDEIAINGEAIFPGGTYAEMRITNCGSANRMASTEQTQLNDFFNQQQQIADSLNYIVADSLMNLYVKNYVDSISGKYNTLDVCKLSISPNPAQNFITINFSNDHCFENIKTIHLIDVNGREFELEKSPKINIEKYTSGSYILKILMIDGTVNIDKLIKI